MPPAQTGQVKSYTNGIGNKIQYQYKDNGAGFLETATDALGRTITYGERTKYGNPKSITYPDYSTEEWTYDDLDLVLTYKNQLGQVTTYTRDGKHRVTRIDNFDDSYETFTYNDFGQVLDHQRRNGSTEHNVFNGEALKASFTDAEGNITTYTHDEHDLLKTVTDARGNISEYKYNERGQVTKMINPGGSFQVNKYDKFGNRDTVINELGKSWITEYDEFRRPKKLITPLKPHTEYFYELPGGGCCSYTENSPSKIKLPSGKITEFAYDAEWNLIRETVGAGTSDEATTHFIRNVVGNPVWTIDPMGKGLYKANRLYGNTW
jgi:YD repeat-containing protein